MASFSVQLRRFSALAAFSAVSTVVLPAQGLLSRGQGPSPDTAPPEVATVVDANSPRAAIEGFLAAMRANDLPRAAAALDLSGVDTARSGDLARRLSAVLDARLWLDLERLSPAAIGDTADGLPDDRELLGTVAVEDRTVSIRLARLRRDGVLRWVFSSGTVAEIDAMYGALSDSWIREHLPPILLDSGPFDVQWWQWIALLILIPLAGLAGLLLAGPTQATLKRLVSRTDTDLDDLLVASIRGPIVLLLGAITSRLLLRWIALPAPAESFVVDLQRATAVVALFWIILRIITVLQSALPVSAWGATHPALRSLIPLGARIARLLVLLLGLLAVIASFGYEIATLLAGLGIGGIAVALGAQKSLEHFFGSVSIGIDQPFRVGDYVRIGDVDGEVESIGLRSTRIRTLDRTVVTMPNGILADSRAENFGSRDRFRFRTVIGLEYGTTAAQLTTVRDGIDAMLRAHPKLWTDFVAVRFFQFGASSLDIEVFCWLTVSDINEFRIVREELLLSIMRIVEGAGASFAFPTQTLMLRQDGPRGDAGSR
ncbi:MAG: mechanosensitive ion channel family protein [Gemmatimonadaceae bacterium]|nr:mechanosensitive ion channel family protein [Gemmatimonadaceae bacterium]